MGRGNGPRNFSWSDGLEEKKELDQVATVKQKTLAKPPTVISARDRRILRRLGPKHQGNSGRYAPSHSKLSYSTLEHAFDLGL